LCPASGETAGLEHLPSHEGHPHSEWARLLSSLPEDERWCGYLTIKGDSAVQLDFGPNWKRYRLAMQVGYGEFLRAVASSEVVFREKMWVILEGDDSLKPMEAFANALRQSGNTFRKLEVSCWKVSPIPFAKCISSALLGNDAIQDLYLDFHSGIWKKIGKEEAVEFMGILGVLHILRILKSVTIAGSDWENEGMRQLLKPFNSLDSVLEELNIHSPTSDAQLEHIGDLLVASTSLKTLFLYSNHMKNEFLKGYTSMASALCSNRFLQSLKLGSLSSMELKALLNPLMPKTNNMQANTTLTHLRLKYYVGGKEGIETLVDMLRTNTSLLELSLYELEELCFQDAQAIENVLATLEALKTNKSLKKIGFPGCSAVGGYKCLEQ